MHMRCILSIAAALVAVAVTAAPAGAGDRPVVVELFTSQGCSSCPPADALLRELSRRTDVLALGYHIDYWDRLGWKDPLSSKESTERQRAYAKRLSAGQIYTPQLVVDGVREMIGSRREEVLAALREAQPVTSAPVSFAADRRSVSVGAGTGKGTVLLAHFLRHRQTDVAAGENAGRTADDVNGVRVLSVLGDWDGAARSYPVDPPAAGEGLAVLVQAADGKMLGATSE